jgi:hypothetical protein
MMAISETGLQNHWTVGTSGAIASGSLKLALFIFDGALVDGDAVAPAHIDCVRRV